MQTYDLLIVKAAKTALRSMSKVLVAAVKDVPDVKGAFYLLEKDGEILLDGTTTGSLRTTIKRHLFRQKKWGASSALAFETTTIEELRSAIANGLVKPTHEPYFKHRTKNTVALNGINIHEYTNSVFYVHYVETKYPSVYKTAYREDNAVPAYADMKSR